MSKYHDAAEVLTREAQRYEGLILAAKALHDLGAMEQAVTVATRTIEQSGKEIEALKAETVKLKATATQMKADHAQKMRENEAQISATRIQAAGAIEEMNAVATESIRNKDAEAKAKAERIVTAAQEAANALIAQRDKLAGEVAALEAAAKRAADDADAAQAKLAKAQAAIAKMLG